MKNVALYEIASARSGDKGEDSNVGVWTRTEAAYEFLRENLTPELVKRHLGVQVHGAVERFELPNLRALNFMLHDALDGGGTASLRTDAQGKVYCLGLLQLRLDVPDELVG